MAQSPRFVRLPARVARWLLPWLSVLAFSSSLAFAANLGLVATWSQPPPPPTAPPSEARWVSVNLTGRDGARFGARCLVRPDFFASDPVTMDVQDFDLVASEACLQIEASATT